MSREPESTGRKVARVAFITLLLPIILPLAVVGLVLSFLNKVVVYLLVWVWWLPRGKDVLYVSSDSPIWKDYMETEVLPLVAQRAIVLSWSARSKWPRWSFAVRVFRTFGRGRNFNPMVVFFRPFRRARIFRFLPAFQEQKQGNSASIEQLHRDLMQALQQTPG
jgi:hypothetical protein